MDINASSQVDGNTTPLMIEDLYMTTSNAPMEKHKVHAGLSYTIVLKENDSNVYLDIDELGLQNHEVRTTCPANAWDDLEREADKAAVTIIDLHNAAPKGFL